MAGIIVDSGERLLLDTALLNLPGNVVKLAKAAFTVRNNQVVTDFTEADFDGYAPEPLIYAGLMPANPGGRAIATFNSVVFAAINNAVPNLIYGYWFESAAGVLIGVERYAGLPKNMIAAGDTITIDQTLRLWSPS